MPATFSPTLGMNTKNEKKMANRQIEVTATFTPHYQLKIFIKGDMPKAMNKIKSQSWQKNGRETKGWKRLIGDAALFYRPEKPLEKFSIVATRKSHRMLDYDGLVASLKPCIDALKDVVIMDDRWSCTGPWIVDQEFRSKAQGSILEITITQSI